MAGIYTFTRDLATLSRHTLASHRALRRPALAAAARYIMFSRAADMSNLTIQCASMPHGALFATMKCLTFTRVILSEAKDLILRNRSMAERSG